TPLKVGSYFSIPLTGGTGLLHPICGEIIVVAGTVLTGIAASSTSGATPRNDLYHRVAVARGSRITDYGS
ncbi:MAG: hypothetical protein P1S59_06250, partial [bacterium]|nr:hypothetical protein [bacterium]